MSVGSLIPAAIGIAGSLFGSKSSGASSQNAAYKARNEALYKLLQQAMSGMSATGGKGSGYSTTQDALNMLKNSALFTGKYR